MGRNTNLAMSAIMANGQANVTNDYFITAGVGARLQYVINSYIDVYLDQAWTYNWDQSGPLYGIMPQNNQLFTTTLGAKFNVWDELQLGLQAFYMYNALTGSPTAVQQYQLYQQNQIGTMATIGLTY